MCTDLFQLPRLVVPLRLGAVEHEFPFYDEVVAHAVSRRVRDRRLPVHDAHLRRCAVHPGFLLQDNRLSVQRDFGVAVLGCK